MKKIIQWILSIVIVILCLGAGLIGWLSVTEFKPEETEEVSVSGTSMKQIHAGDTVSVLSWNLGYGALGDNADFFMDGGTSVNTASIERVHENMDGIISAVEEMNPDVMFFQETDVNSNRSHHINEVELLQNTFPDKMSSFAYNFKVNFIPYPIPPMGKVGSGLLTLSEYAVSSAERIALPCPFSWPVRLANLKRCLLINRIPVEGSNHELVLVNLHLEAYDDGEGKIAQTKMLKEILEAETAKGNYVIAGGDFNQIFSNADTSKYPAQEGKWQAGEIDVEAFNDSLSFLMDANVPSCRSLDQAYENADQDTFQYYLIDGFIVSDNITVNALQTEQYDFAYTDHNPVLLNITLQD